jgi:hypothetical protein
MNIRILFFSLLIFSCNQKKSENTFSINQSRKPLKDLQNLVINKGDTSAYYELFNESVDRAVENSELFYFSYVMAFKYNYPKAYIDVFSTLCQTYNIDIEADKINLNGMDIQTKRLAMECLKRAADSNYLDSKSIYQSLPH